MAGRAYSSESGLFPATASAVIRGWKFSPLFKDNSNLVDQSRRIDNVREELVGMIGETNKRIDVTNMRMAGSMK